jgi:hypothetical protein
MPNWDASHLRRLKRKCAITDKVGFVKLFVFGGVEFLVAIISWFDQFLFV